MIFYLFDKYDVQKCKIVLLEKVNVNSKVELKQKEAMYIKNNKCVNKMMPNRTPKQYYQDNKEYINERNRKYNKNNREKLQEYSKQWSEENKELKKEINKRYREQYKEKLEPYPIFPIFQFFFP